MRKDVIQPVDIVGGNITIENVVVEDFDVTDRSDRELGEVTVKNEVDAKLIGSTVPDEEALPTRNRSLVVKELSDPSGDLVAAGATKLYSLSWDEFKDYEEVAFSFQETSSVSHKNTLTFQLYVQGSSSALENVELIASGDRSGGASARTKVHSFRTDHNTFGAVALKNEDVVDHTYRVMQMGVPR